MCRLAVWLGLIFALAPGCKGGATTGSGVPPRTPEIELRKRSPPPPLPKDARPIDHAKINRILNGRHPEHGWIHASDDGGCHVYVADKKQRPPGAYPPAQAVECPPEMLAVEWGYCPGAGTVQSNESGDECTCSPGDGDPPAPSFRMPCPGPPAQQPPEKSRFAKLPRPKVSPVCERARDSFGYGAECLETELTDLETAAGKVWRVVRKGDATASWTYVLVKPDGSMIVLDGGKLGFILDEILKALDVTAIPPEKLAILHAALAIEAAVVRCLPGTKDALPNDRNGQPLPCTPPAIATNGERLELTYIIEKFPHPRLARREEHTVSRELIEVKPRSLWRLDGTDLLDLPRDTPLPLPTLPVPVMTTPPAWVAEPVAAPADVSAAICAAARKRFPVFEGQRCQAYAYPALDLPTGSLYYVANDAGVAHAHAVKKPDGTFVVDYNFTSEDNPLLPIIKSYDPATVPPAKLMAAYLFLKGESARILCVPGSGDVIPGHECKPPSVAKKEDKLVLTAILEMLPFPDLNGMTDEPAVRSMVYELSPNGQMRGKGVLLIDQRE